MLIGDTLKIFDDGSKPIIKASPRVGIKNDTHLLWRFYTESNAYVRR